MRFYISNDSYPELQEIRSRWDRHVLWWRAFGSALRDGRFWWFVTVQVGLITLFLTADRVLLAPAPDPVRLVPAGACVVVIGVLVTSWGGDLIRPHLRRVSPVARASCPGCGHLLTGHLHRPDEALVCPECAARVPRSVLEPPFAIPREFRAFRLGLRRRSR